MFLAQTGERHPSAKPMKDNLRKVTEVRMDSADGNTYRVAYVANLAADALLPSRIYQEGHERDRHSKADP